MDKNKLFSRYLVNKKTNLENAIERAKDARDNAPAATESHSDTRRSQAEKLITVFEAELDDLVMLTKKISAAQLAYIELEIDYIRNKFLIVPSGMGGSEMENIRFISEDTPMGLSVMNRKIGETFDFNNQKIKILKVE